MHKPSKSSQIPAFCRSLDQHEGSNPSPSIGIVIGIRNTTPVKEKGVVNQGSTSLLLEAYKDYHTLCEIARLQKRRPHGSPF